MVLTGIPILEANTTVSADASSIVNPLWRGEGGGGGAKTHFSLKMPTACVGGSGGVEVGGGGCPMAPPGHIPSKHA